MSINVNDFLGLVNTKGFAHPNRYLVELPSIDGIDQREMNLLCNAVNLPGKQILSSDFEIGMKFEKIVYGYAVDDITLNFNVTNDFKVKEYFEKWSDLAIDFQRNELRFKDTYVKNISIFHLDKAGHKIYGCKLFDSFPSTLNPIEMGNAQTDTVTEYNVQLSYTTWKPIYFSNNQPRPSVSEVEEFRAAEARGFPVFTN